MYDSIKNFTTEDDKNTNLFNFNNIEQKNFDLFNHQSESDLISLSRVALELSIQPLNVAITKILLKREFEIY